MNSRHTPTAGTLRPWIISLAIVWLLHYTVMPSLNPYYYSVLIFAAINAIGAVSLNLVNGCTGQFSMGHAGFMSIGAYSATVITMYLEPIFGGGEQALSALSWIFLPSLLFGGLVASLAGILVGLPTLRLRGDYLAVVTLGFGEIIRVVILNVNAIGGARGLPNIAPLTHFGWVYSLLVITIFVIWKLMRSPYGRGFLSVREDEIAAESMGVQTTKVKLVAFAVSAFFVGIAGGLFAHFLRYLNPHTFDFSRSFELIIMVVLGGMGSISGAVLSAFLLTFLKEGLRPLQQITHVDLRMVIFSLLLIILMLTRPYGLMGRKEITDLSWFRRFFSKLPRGVTAHECKSSPISP